MGRNLHTRFMRGARFHYTSRLNALPKRCVAIAALAPIWGACDACDRSKRARASHQSRLQRSQGGLVCVVLCPRYICLKGNCHAVLTRRGHARARCRGSRAKLQLFRVLRSMVFAVGWARLHLSYVPAVLCIDQRKSVGLLSQSLHLSMQPAWDRSVRGRQARLERVWPRSPLNVFA
jgi:hypothetical protein